MVDAPEGNEAWTAVKWRLSSDGSTGKAVCYKKGQRCQLAQVSSAAAGSEKEAMRICRLLYMQYLQDESICILRRKGELLDELKKPVACKSKQSSSSGTDAVSLAAEVSTDVVVPASPMTSVAAPSPTVSEVLSTGKTKSDDDLKSDPKPKRPKTCPEQDSSRHGQQSTKKPKLAAPMHEASADDAPLISLVASQPRVCVPAPSDAPEASAVRKEARPRETEPLPVIDAVIGYQGDTEPDPTPIKLVGRGKQLEQGEVFETQSEEIRKSHSSSPIAKTHRARFNWVAQTIGGKFTRDPEKMIPSYRISDAGRWTCDVCGRPCSDQLYVFRAFLRKEHLMHHQEPRRLEPFIAYISQRCGRGLLGQLSEYARFKEEIFSLASTDLSLDEVRSQLEDSLARCGKEDRQFILDELERLAGVGPGGARKTLEMEAVEAATWP